MQEERVRELRQRATTITSTIVSVVVIAVGLSGSGLNRAFVGIAGVAVMVAVGAAAYALMPQKGYVAGPNIDTMHEVQYNLNHPAGRVMRDIALYHFRNVNMNEAGPVKRITDAVVVELVAAAAAVLFVLLAYVV